MTIQNINSLAEQLKTLGFVNLNYSLVQRICLKPETFFLYQRMEKGKDQISFQLFFNRDHSQNAYLLEYYDAILQKEPAMNDITIEGIDIAGLEKRMEEINWKATFDFSNVDLMSADDKPGWVSEAKVELIMEDLLKLEAGEQGKSFAVGLKLRYWEGLPYQELVENIISSRVKSELWQRFYFLEGQPGIPADEAYRFLQNKWLEKRILVKVRPPEQTHKHENSGNVGAGNRGVPKKKKLSKRKPIKSK